MVDWTICPKKTGRRPDQQNRPISAQLSWTHWVSQRRRALTSSGLSSRTNLRMSSSSESPLSLMGSGSSLAADWGGWRIVSVGRELGPAVELARYAEDDAGRVDDEPDATGPSCRGEL